MSDCETCGNKDLECACAFRPKSFIQVEKDQRIWENIQRSEYLEKLDNMHKKPQNLDISE